MDTHEWSMLLVSQVLQVSALWLVVAGINHLWTKNRPHLAHALWIIVLLKCLTPPFWSSPSSVFSWLSEGVSNIYFTERKALDPKADSTVPVNEATSKTPESLPVGESIERLPSANETRTLHSVSHAQINTAPQASSRQASLRIILVMVCLGFVVGLTRAAVRLVLFLRCAYRSGYQEDETLTALVDRLRKKLGMRQRVRVHLIQAPIGPAVVGLFRPTLLLPQMLVSGSCVTRLEPLLAHELIHVRRGDLWWSLVQTLATYLWWFHPGVRYAARMATFEAERSCDEETVLSLGCSAATYARALLEVLERRQEMIVAPGLPGVRPVDITRKRMERIMQLGHGGHRRSPRWFWGLLFVLSATVLPSAALSSPQEDPPVIGPVPAATGPIANKFENYRCDVGELLDVLQRNGFSEEEASREILLRLPVRDTAHFAEIAKDLGLPGKLEINLPAPQIDGRQLRVFEAKSQVSAIKLRLDELRKSRFRQANYEVQVFDCSLDDYVSLLKSCPGVVRNFVADSVITASGIKIEGVDDLLNIGVLVPDTLALERPDQTLVATGKWLASQGNEVLIADTGSQALPNAFIVDQQGLMYLSRNARLNPHGGGLSANENWQGHTFQVQSQLLHHENGKATAMNELTARVESVPTEQSSFKSSLEFSLYRKKLFDQEVSEEQAAAKPTLRVKVNAELSSGQTLVLGGIRTKASAQERFFIVRLTETMRELTQLQVQNALLKLKALANAPPIPLLGPVKTQERDVEIEPPTDDEMARAIVSRLDDFGPLYGHTQFQFELKKTGEQVDPPRYIPLIGQSKLHHVFYECTFTCKTHPEITGTVKFDRNCFEMVESEEAR